jgi:Flp pilus assembly protein TadG
MIRYPKQQQRSDRRGAAMVEMALILPIFFAVVLGVIEFGRAMMVAQLVTGSAREGARLGSLDGSTNNQVVAQVRTFLQSTLNVDPGVITVTITIEPAPGNDDPGNEVAFAQSRDLITVRVDLPFDEVSYLPGRYLEGRNLNGVSAMRRE